MKKLNLKRQLTSLALFLGILGTGLSLSYGITVTNQEKVSMSVVVGGGLQQLSILHSPIKNVSQITRKAIIQGTAGTDPAILSAVDTRASFGSRFTAQDSSPEAAGETIEITVYFRIVNPNQTGILPPFMELSRITGPDPTSFAFQVMPSSITTGQLQYKIRARKFKGGTVVGMGWFPANAKTPQDVFNQPVGIQAGASQVVGLNGSGGQVIILDGNPNDGQSILNIPAGLFNSPTSISFNEISPDSTLFPELNLLNQPESIYQIDVSQGFRGSMVLSVLFPDFVFLEGGKDGNLDVSENPVNTATLFWWDGFRWRPIGGKIDETNLITARINRSGLYAVVSAPPISPEDRRPFEKIITPNGDGVNDEATFMLGAVLENVTIDIFDITGHRVRTINTSSNIFNWDGRDDSGKILESGVYIYQYKLEGKRVSGLVAIAK